MPTIRKVYKQGNSLVIALPSFMADHIGVNAGDEIVWEIHSTRLLHVMPFKTHHPPNSTSPTFAPTSNEHGNA